MRSSKAKVLHEVAGRSLLCAMLLAGNCRGWRHIDRGGVIGPGQDAVAAEAQRAVPDAVAFHSSMSGAARRTCRARPARPALEKQSDDILIVYGDTPLIRPQTLVAPARTARRRRGDRRARLSPREIRRPWTADHGGAKSSSPFAKKPRRARASVRSRSLQRRHHRGLCRQQRACHLPRRSATPTANTNSI